MNIPPGLIETPALLRTGITTDSIHRKFRAGELVRVRRGYYVETSRWLEAKPWDRFAWSLAAASRAVPGLTLCRETAAFAMGIPVLRTPTHVECITAASSRSGRGRPTLSVLGQSPAARKIRQEGGFPLRFHLGKERNPDMVGGYACTALVQTVLDVAFTSRLSQSLVVADGAAREMWKQGRLDLHGSLLDVDGIAIAVRGNQNASARRRAEVALSLATPLSESAGESYSRAAFHYLGFQQPELQHRFTDANGFIGRADFWWPPSSGRRGVVGEFDGKGKYLDAELRNGATPEEVLYKEKLREDRIRALGFGFVRWGWPHVENPERLRRKLLQGGLSPARDAGRIPWNLPRPG